MFKYYDMPSSKASPIKLRKDFTFDGFRFTSLPSHDEKILYIVLNEELCLLESTLKIDKEKLNSIEQKLKYFILEFELRDEILLRVKRLESLYHVYEAIESQDIRTKEEVKQMLIKIAPTKAGPLRTYVKKQLQTLQKTLPSEELVQLTPAQKFMEKMNSEEYKPFAYLGKWGQEYVIQDVIRKYGNKASVEQIKEISLEIGNIVNDLKYAKDPVEVVNTLEALPITVFSTLAIDRKIEIAKRLLELRNWETFESLNRVVKLLNKVISIEKRKKEEAGNVIHINDGKEAIKIGINKAKKEFIKIV